MLLSRAGEIVLKTLATIQNQRSNSPYGDIIKFSSDCSVVSGITTDDSSATSTISTTASLKKEESLKNARLAAKEQKTGTTWLELAKVACRRISPASCFTKTVKAQGQTAKDDISFSSY